MSKKFEKLPARNRSKEEISAELKKLAAETRQIEAEAKKLEAEAGKAEIEFEKSWSVRQKELASDEENHL